MIVDHDITPVCVTSGFVVGSARYADRPKERPRHSTGAARTRSVMRMAKREHQFFGELWRRD
jgi:hypothetical protein